MSPNPNFEVVKLGSPILKLKKRGSGIHAGVSVPILAQALACSSYDSESTFAFLAFFTIMSAERLLWLAGEIHKGRSAFVSFSYNSQLRREKIKFTLGDCDLDAAVYRPCIVAALSAI